MFATEKVSGHKKRGERKSGRKFVFFSKVCFVWSFKLKFCGKKFSKKELSLYYVFSRPVVLVLFHSLSKD